MRERECCLGVPTASATLRYNFRCEIVMDVRACAGHLALPHSVVGRLPSRCHAECSVQLWSGKATALTKLVIKNRPRKGYGCGE